MKASTSKFRGVSSRPLPTETSEQLKKRLNAYAALTRARAMRRVTVTVPDNVVVLAGPRRRVAV